jgi:hypothetical protein
MSGRVIQSIVLAGLVVLVVAAEAQQTKKKKDAPPDTTVTFKGVKDLGTLKDGAYEADGWYRKHNYRTVAFTKRGSTVTGFTADNAGVWCIQGTFEGNVIHIADAVRWVDEYENGRQTGRHHFAPLFEHDQSDFVTIRMDEELSSFPRYRIGSITTPGWVVARDENWMAGCLKYYRERREPLGPAPCDEEELRATMPEPGQMPTYIIGPEKICDMDDSDDCTVENVFDLLIETPAAIGPAKDPERQRVRDCGVLRLQSFTNVMKLEKHEKAEDDNSIRVDIDEENHRIINYTMPGHVFWPGQVIRRVVAYGRNVGVQTTGYGREDVVKKWGLNLFTAGAVWSRADGALREAFEEAYEEDD